MADIKEEKELWQEIRELERRLTDKIEQLRKDMHEETKTLREEIHRLDLKISYLDKKFTILILIVIFLIIFLNQNALEFLLRLAGLLK